MALKLKPFSKGLHSNTDQTAQAVSVVLLLTISRSYVIHFPVTNKWECGSLLSHKAPTSVLFDEEAHFHSFGYEAEEKYMELAEDEDVEDWFYFQRFKMKLQGQKVNI